MYREHLPLAVGPGVLHAERLGRGGPAVLLLHGFGTCTFLWRAIAPALATAGCTVVGVDLLGFGESDRPSGAAYGPGAQAGYLERALTVLRLPEVAVVGQDLGALVALQLAAAHPRRVRRLALLEPPDLGEPPPPLVRAVQRASASAALGANSLFGARPLVAALLTAALAGAEPPPRLVARYLAPFTGANGTGELLQLAGSVGIGVDEAPHLAAVTAPTLLWCGRDDGDRQTARLAAWRAALPQAPLRPIPTSRPAGTLVAEDTPEALTSALLAWLT